MWTLLLRILSLVACTVFPVSVYAQTCTGQAAFKWPDACVEPVDKAMAEKSPDEYAWRLFVALNWPADVANRKADSTKKFGSEGPATWETWRLAYKEVYLPDGRDPGDWLSGKALVARRTIDFEKPLQLAIVDAEKAHTSIQLQIDQNFLGGNETRMNKDTFMFVRKNELYNLEGQEALFAKGVETIEFPEGAKEIKAQWRRLDNPDCPLDQSRYHTAVVDHDGRKEIWGLTSLHITTKDLPEWFWATFEHVDNPKLCGILSDRPNEGWLLKSVDHFACPLDKLDCNEAPKGIGLENTVWRFYRLRGTQTKFVNDKGVPTKLANSQPEAGFQQTSSCITCHSRATIGLLIANPLEFPNRLAVFKSFDPVAGFVGSPDPAWFKGSDGKLNYTKLDFVWSFFRACRKGGGGCSHPCANNPALCQ
jgi:hypothetical protein